MDEQTLLNKISHILEIPINRLQWDISYQEIIQKLVETYERENDNFYANEGIAVMVKGKIFYGIHPDNVENNLNNLINGNMRINWEHILEYLRELESKK